MPLTQNHHGLCVADIAGPDGLTIEMFDVEVDG